MARTLRLLPFEEFGGVRFGHSEDAVLGLIGLLVERTVGRRSGRVEFVYADEDEAVWVTAISKAAWSQLRERRA